MTTRIFSEEKASGFLKNNNQTFTQSKHHFLLSAKRCFLSVERFFFHKNKPQIKTQLCFSTLLSFPIDLFFVASKNLCEPSRFCLPRNLFPFPAFLLQVKKPFLPERIFYSFIFYSLCISFSTVQGCADCKAVRQTR